MYLICRSVGARSKAAKQAASEGPSVAYSRGNTSSIPATTSAAKGADDKDDDVLMDRQTNAPSATGCADAACHTLILAGAG